MDDDQLQDLRERLTEFCDILGAELRLLDLPESQRAKHLGQLQGIQCALSLIGQLEKRGRIWRGGYLDNHGLVHRDLVKERLAVLTERERIEA